MRLKECHVILVYSEMYMLAISEGLKNKYRDAYRCIFLLAALEKKQTRDKQQNLKNCKDLDVYRILTYMVFDLFVFFIRP